MSLSGQGLLGNPEYWQLEPWPKFRACLEEIVGILLIVDC